MCAGLSFFLLLSFCFAMFALAPDQHGQVTKVCCTAGLFAHDLGKESGVGCGDRTVIGSFTNV